MRLGLQNSKHDVFNVFIVAPMGDETEMTSSKERINNIKKGAEEALKSVLGTKKKYEVLSPYDLNGSNITSDVFHQIDIADFAIADISNRRPSVMYEIALFHALGTPMVILQESDEHGTSLSNTPFYFKDSRLLRIAGFTKDAIKIQLEATFSSFFNDKVIAALNENPVTKFYSAPLVDISAATGLAVGYFANFIQHVLREKTGLLASEKNPLKRLIIVRPLGINTRDRDAENTDRKFPEAIEAKIKVEAHPRGAVFLERVHKELIIDVPTPIYTLKFSPRRNVLKRKFRDVQYLNKHVVESIMTKMEQQMIDVFFRTIENLAEDYNIINDHYIWQIQKSDQLNYPFS